MTIEFHCPDCDKLLRTSDEKAGLTANCPACNCSIIVPPAEGSIPTAGDMRTDRDADSSPGKFKQKRGDRDYPCGTCGATLSPYDTICPHCGDKQPTRFAPVRQYQKDETLAIVSLVTGLLSVGLYCCLSVLTFPLALIAVITGIISIRRTNDGRNMAIGGICSGAVSLLLTFAYIAFIVIMLVSQNM